VAHPGEAIQLFGHNTRARSAGPAGTMSGIVLPSSIAAGSVSGSLWLRRRKLRSTWYVNWRDADGEQHHGRVGLLWEAREEPPAGEKRRYGP
jgi:hypothetical protein